MRLKKWLGLGLAMVLALNSATPALAGMWEQSGEAWKVKENGSYLKDMWYEDGGNWYRLGTDGQMVSGLYTDSSTGKSFLLNTQHDGTFGRMIVTDGTYIINGENKSLTFNRQHDGNYGCILSGGIKVPTGGSGSGGTQGEMTPEEKAALDTLTKEVDKAREEASGDIKGNGPLSEAEQNIGMY